MTTTTLAAAIRAIPVPERMRKLPISAKGFPVPWFVAWLDDGRETLPGKGAPDFRVIGADRLRRAWGLRRCWICGEPLGRYQVLAVGPMCVVNRTTSEPGSHRDCVRYAIRACPFLANPRMRRNEVDQAPQRVDAPGLHLDHNPGVMALWTTRHVTPFDAAGHGKPGTLFRFLDEPLDVEWWMAGRLASRVEVQSAIEAGLPLLRTVAERDRDVPAFERMVGAAQRWLP